MKLFNAYVVIAVAATVIAANADNVQWKSAVSGNWSDGTKWDAGHAPTSADTPKFVDGTYTITNDTGADLAVAGLGSNNAGLHTIDLQGHALTISGTGALGNYAKSPADGMRFLNGSITARAAPTR